MNGALKSKQMWIAGCLALVLGYVLPLRAAELVVAFDASQGEFPESITRDENDNLYWSSGAEIRQRTPDGEMTLYGTLPIDAYALGVKVGPDHCVYTVSTSLSDVAGAFVWRICAPGEVTRFATLDPSGGPNDLVIDETGNLLVTDPFLGRIWKIAPDGTAQVWLEHPLLNGDPDDPALVFHTQGVNGIVFDHQKKNLYVGNLDRGEILRIRLKQNGSPGNISVWVSDPRLVGVDGLALDATGHLFAAVNAQDSIVMISPNKKITLIESGGLLDGPSSLVFAACRSTAPLIHTLWIANSSFSRAFGFIPGEPRPALLTTEIGPLGWKPFFRYLQELRHRQHGR